MGAATFAPSRPLATLGPSVYRAHSHLCTVIRRYKGPEVEIRTLGIDLAKNVFRVHGGEARGKTTVQRQLRHRQVLPFMAQLPTCLVGMEACGGSH